MSISVPIPTWVGDSARVGRRALFLIFLLAVSVGVGAAEVELLVLHTADIHAHLDPADGRGGWLQLATVLRNRRALHGADRTLVVDTGDTIQGTFAGRFTRGDVAVRLLNELEYDVWVPGNHELDFGVPCLARLCAMAGDKVLNGNLAIAAEPGGPLRGLPAWRVFQRGGARIVVIGANSSFLRNWFWEQATPGFRVQTVLTMLDRIMPAIRKMEADLVILAVHQGYMSEERDTRDSTEVTEAIDRFPEIDLVLGGHTHRSMPGWRLSRSTWYVQTSAHAGELGVVRVTVDTDRHRVMDIASELVRIPANTPEDRACATAVAEQRTAIRAAAAQRVGMLTTRLDSWGTPGVSCQTSEFLSAAIAAATGAHVVVQGRLGNASFGPGAFTEADLFELVPYENDLGIAHLTPAEIREILSEQQRWRNAYVFCGVWGAQATLARDGTVTTLCDARGNPFPGDVRIPVAFNSYTLAGGGGRFPVLRRITRQPICELRKCEDDTREAVRRYLRIHDPCNPPAPREWLQRASGH